MVYSGISSAGGIGYDFYEVKRKENVIYLITIKFTFMNLPKWLMDILTNMILPIAKIAGKNGLIEAFKNINEKNPDLYRTIVIIGYRGLVVHLKPLADDTTTPWDNETVDLVIAALAESATANGVPLPDVTIIDTPALPAP